MAKDERLYARFDIAMDEHPKIMLLSDAAFRTLIEATLYSRRQLTDGFLADGVARRKWSPDALDELGRNDPEKPSLFAVEKDGVKGLMIHDYEKHQTTTADIEAKRDAGRKGGLAKAKQNASKPLADTSNVPLAESKQTSSAPLAITETETETETIASQSSAKKPSVRLPKNWVPTASHFERAAASGVDLQKQVEAFRLHAETHDRHAANWNAAFTTWLSKAKPSSGVKVPAKDEWMYR